MGIDVESQKTIDEAIDRVRNEITGPLVAALDLHATRFEALVKQLMSFKATGAAGFYPDK